MAYARDANFWPAPSAEELAMLVVDMLEKLSGLPPQSRHFHLKLGASVAMSPSMRLLQSLHAKATALGSVVRGFRESARATAYASGDKRLEECVVAAVDALAGALAVTRNALKTLFESVSAWNISLGNFASTLQMIKTIVGTVRYEGAPSANVSDVDKMRGELSAYVAAMALRVSEMEARGESGHPTFQNRLSAALIGYFSHALESGTQPGITRFGAAVLTGLLRFRRSISMSGYGLVPGQFHEPWPDFLEHCEDLSDRGIRFVHMVDACLGSVRRAADFASSEAAEIAAETTSVGAPVDAAGNVDDDCLSVDDILSSFTWEGLSESYGI